MFCYDDNTTVELLGIFKIKRDTYRHSSFAERHYDGLSMRLDGCATFHTGTRTLRVQPGDVLYCPPQAQYVQETDGETVIVVHFICYSHHVGTDLEKITPENVAEIQKLMLTMYDLWSRKQPGYQYAATSCLYQLMYHIRQQRHEQALQTIGPTDRLAAAMDYLHKHYKQDKVSVAQLAKLSALSETYFRQLFRQVYGVSPCRYITNLRLELALQLLRSQLYTVSEVSEKVGFHDVKYFERVFKQHYHTTPAACKKQIPETVFR